jgi:protein SCO1/2
MTLHLFILSALCAVLACGRPVTAFGQTTPAKRSSSADTANRVSKDSQATSSSHCAHHAHAPAHPTSTNGTTALGSAPTDSVYQLTDALVDHNGQKIKLDLYRGHPVLVAMFYATCRKVCPVIVSKIKSLDASLPAEVKQDTRVLLMSFDRTRDTPKVLRELAATHGLDMARTTLATTSDAGVRKIAAVLGVQYRRMADGEYDHSAVIALLDREGRVAYRLDGLNQDPAPLRKALIQVATPTRENDAMPSTATTPQHRGK